MTEAEWLACCDPRAMLHHCQDLISMRKKRLYLVACCRSIWEAICDDRSKHATRVAERFADGSASDSELNEAHTAAKAVSDPLWQSFYLAPDEGLRRTASALVAAVNAASYEWHFNAGPTAAWAVGVDGSEACARELKRQSDMLRCIVGDPILPVAFPLDWATATIAALAQAAYEDRLLPSGNLDNARLAVLSDALEEAGCTDAGILSHLRSPGPHVRGCWALDLILNKG